MLLESAWIISGLFLYRIKILLQFYLEQNGLKCLQVACASLVMSPSLAECDLSRKSSDLEDFAFFKTRFGASAQTLLKSKTPGLDEWKVREIGGGTTTLPLVFSVQCSQ